MSTTATGNTTKPATLAEIKRAVNTLFISGVKVRDNGDGGVTLVKEWFIADVTPAMFDGEYAYITTYVNASAALSVIRNRDDLRVSLLRIFDGSLAPGLGAAVVHSEHR